MSGPIPRTTHYTRKQIDNILSNRPMKEALFDLVIVPRELASKVEVELDDGFVLAKTSNVINTNHRFGGAYLIRKIEEQRPDILCASDSTFIDENSLAGMIEYENQPTQEDIMQEMCYSCEPCQA